MFNFMFEGAIGDILAPVTNKLFLAIQHHKNDEVHQLMLNNDLQKISDGGYGAIHVSCKYNNRFALEMILSKGESLWDTIRLRTQLIFHCPYFHTDKQE